MTCVGKEEEHGNEWEYKLEIIQVYNKKQLNSYEHHPELLCTWNGAASPAPMNGGGGGAECADAHGVGGWDERTSNLFFFIARSRLSSKRQWLGGCNCGWWLSKVKKLLTPQMMSQPQTALVWAVDRGNSISNLIKVIREITRKVYKVMRWAGKWYSVRCIHCCRVNGSNVYITKIKRLTQSRCFKWINWSGKWNNNMYLLLSHFLLKSSTLCIRICFDSTNNFIYSWFC